MEAKVREVLGRLLPKDADEFTVDYLVSVLVDDVDKGADEVTVSVGPFLLDMGAAADEDEVEVLCGRIVGMVLGKDEPPQAEPAAEPPGGGLNP
eukprot:CAMPEP_0182868112 /NCGR_PEP_ID=MMETSP0034_2-20130328/9122_1 /TAXON_ID=156128 /ORGANISM="Nephroselmis pyriformis, Strain CCMP717" /LENGTH=93 /DNA_ID=CAMNT_0025000503 /DNA_START=136 /DNA_END=413 /DNA_ORIENTATION=+